MEALPTLPCRIRRCSSAVTTPRTARTEPQSSRKQIPPNTQRQAILLACPTTEKLIQRRRSTGTLRVLQSPENEGTARPALSSRMLDALRLRKNIQVYCTALSTIGPAADVQESSRFVVTDRLLYMLGSRKPTEVRVLNLGTNEWGVLRPKGCPSARLGHSMLVYRDYIVIFGGLTARRRLSKTLKVFHTQTLTWMRMSSFGNTPEPRFYHSAELVGRHMVLYGGVLGAFRKSSDLYFLDLIQFTWIKAEVASPGALSHASLTAVLDSNLKRNLKFSAFHMRETRCFYSFQNSGVYLFGGIDTNKVPNNNVHRLVSSKGVVAWEQVLPSGQPPAPRYGHSASSQGQLLFVFGGRNDTSEFSEFAGVMNDLHVLNVVSCKWEEVQIFGMHPQGRWGHCMQPHSSGFLIFGGSNTRVKMTADVYFIETDAKHIDQSKRRDKNICEENLVQTRRITEAFKESLQTLITNRNAQKLST